MIVEDVLKRLAEDLQTFAKTETIFGDPIEIQGTTMIPVCKMSIGYGGGGGEGQGTATKSGEGTGSGGGAGAGVKIEPAAIIIIKDGDISVVGVSQSSKWEEVLNLIPDAIKKIANLKGEGEHSGESENGQGHDANNSNNA